MGAPTVYLVGSDDLYRIPSYLALGAVVVVATDRPTLRRWEAEMSSETPAPASDPAPEGLVIDLEGRRVRWRGLDLRLTPLEFRILARMAGAPGRAFTFQELRRIGWGPDPGEGIDVYAVRSLIQRLRVKLRASGVTARIESVRSYGFRLETTPQIEPLVVGMNLAVVG